MADLNEIRTNAKRFLTKASGAEILMEYTNLSKKGPYYSEEDRIVIGVLGTFIREAIDHLSASESMTLAQSALSSQGLSSYTEVK